MKCDHENCPNDARLRVKVGMAWGHYCGRHTVDALETLTEEKEWIEVRALEKEA